MSRKEFFLLCVAVSFLTLGSSARASVHIVDPNAGNAQANFIATGNSVGERTQLVGPQLQVGSSFDLDWPNPNGASTNFANAVFTFADSGFFVSDIDNSRHNGFAARQDLRIAFTVDTLTKFTFSGEYLAINNGQASGRSFLETRLIDLTNPSSPPFSTISTFGGFNSGSQPLPVPTITGMLTPGHTYVWSLAIGSLPSGANVPGSTATGDVSLSFTPVPEPASLAIWSGISLVGLVVARRRQTALAADAKV